MPKTLIAFGPGEGALYEFAKAVAGADAHERLTFHDLVVKLCLREVGPRQVDVAQVTELASKLRGLLHENPQGVMEALWGKTT